MAVAVANFSVPPPAIVNQQTNQPQVQNIQFKPFKPPDGDFDGKRLRKSVMRKTVDYNSSIIEMLEARIWQRDERDMPALQADIGFASHMLPPPAYLRNPINAVVTKFVRTSTNKAKCPIFCLAWTPEGRRLVTGASSGEFTLWNGLTFNFETILQAHDKSVREMVWSNNDQWMVTGDADGYVKYWQSNMNNVRTFQAHTESVRGLSFSPSNTKLASGSDDGTVRIWDFFSCKEEKCLRGHGADVKCVAWHPSKSLLASGSKDNQQPINLWDPRTGNSLAKLHAHKSTVMDLKWNSNGNWLVSASRDHTLKLFDVRNFNVELQVFRGHKKEAACLAWHPQHEGLFASGGSDGSLLFWHVGNDKELGMIESAHDGIVWDLAWHPLGHILCSGSNDHTSKFWTRNRVGDRMRDKYNLNTLPPGVVGDDCVDIDDIPVIDSEMLKSVGLIPGMGPDDRVEANIEPNPGIESAPAEATKGPETIPGLEIDGIAFERFLKKTPYAKPIPRTFQAQWNAAGGLDDNQMDDPGANTWVVVEIESMFDKHAETEGDKIISDIGEELPAGTVPLDQLVPDAMAYYGFYVPLNNTTAQDVNDAFLFMDEEEAICELTNDPEFARKLIREKKGLYNPAANPGFEEITPIKQERNRKNDNFRENFRNKRDFRRPDNVRDDWKNRMDRKDNFRDDWRDRDQNNFRNRNRNFNDRRSDWGRNDDINPWEREQNGKRPWDKNEEEINPWSKDKEPREDNRRKDNWNRENRSKQKDKGGIFIGFSKEERERAKRSWSQEREEANNRKRREHEHNRSYNDRHNREDVDRKVDRAEYDRKVDRADFDHKFDRNEYDRKMQKSRRS